MTVQHHDVRFERNRRDGSARAVCTCGWFHLGLTLAECQERAAVHDLDWEPVAPEPANAAVA